MATKPRIQGDAATQMPASRLTHSSHSRNAPIAPSARAPITIALIQAFTDGFRSVLKPRTQGEMNSRIARARFAQSCTCLFSKLLAMTDLLLKINQVRSHPHDLRIRGT